MWAFDHDYDQNDDDNEFFRSQMEKGLWTVSVALVCFLDGLMA